MFGVLAMLVALIAVPMSATNALAMTGEMSAKSGDSSIAAAADEMPCHKRRSTVRTALKKFVRNSALA